MISMTTAGTRSRGANPSNNGTATVITNTISRLSNETSGIGVPHIRPEMRRLQLYAASAITNA
jgi:hypothetical protein